MKTSQSLSVFSTALALLAAPALFAATAAANFEEYCAKCHGLDGKAQTKMGKKMQVRDMTTETYKKEYDNAKATEVIAKGIVKDGKQIKEGYGQKLNAAEITALVEYVKTMK